MESRKNNHAEVSGEILSDKHDDIHGQLEILVLLYLLKEKETKTSYF